MLAISRPNIAVPAIGLGMSRSLGTFDGKPVGLRSVGLSLKHFVRTVPMDVRFDLLVLGVLAIPTLPLLAGITPASGGLMVALGPVLAQVVILSLRTLACGERVPCLEGII
jgi:hypothetical protein